MSRRYDNSIDIEALSRPEGFVHRKQGRGLVEKIINAGGCFFCLRRDRRSEGPNRAVCGEVIPAAFLKEGCTFEPDNYRIHGKGRTE